MKNYLLFIILSLFAVVIGGCDEEKDAPLQFEVFGKVAVKEKETVINLANSNNLIWKHYIFSRFDYRLSDFNVISVSDSCDIERHF